MSNERQNAAPIFDMTFRTGTVVLVLAVMFATTVIAIPAAQAQTYQVLFNFTGNGSNGAHYFPYAGLAITAGGNLYGTTMRGGTYEDGTAFQLKRAGSGWLLNVLHNFQGGSDGTNPVSGITIGLPKKMPRHGPRHLPVGLGSRGFRLFRHALVCAWPRRT